jgi:hypothetical protein
MKRNDLIRQLEKQGCVLLRGMAGAMTGIKIPGQAHASGFPDIEKSRNISLATF